MKEAGASFHVGHKVCEACVLQCCPESFRHSALGAAALGWLLWTSGCELDGLSSLTDMLLPILPHC